MLFLCMFWFDFDVHMFWFDLVDSGDIYFTD